MKSMLQKAAVLTAAVFMFWNIAGAQENFNLDSMNAGDLEFTSQNGKSVKQMMGTTISISPDFKTWFNIEPIPDSKTHYTLPPSSPDTAWWFKESAYCTGESGYYYNVCLSGTIHWDVSEHEHHPTPPPIPPITTEPPELFNVFLGKAYCFNDIPVNTMKHWYVQMPQYAARFNLRLDFSGYCNGIWRDEVDARIQDLAKLSPDNSLYISTGATTWHPDNQNGKPAVLKKLKQIMWEYKQEFPKEPLFVINDISLPWGGLFDVGTTTTPPIQLIPWKPPHTYHRYGRQVDIRSWIIGHKQRFQEICCSHQVQPLLEKSNASSVLKQIDSSAIPSSGPAAKVFNRLLRNESLDLILNDIDPAALPSAGPIAGILDRVEHYHLNFALDPDSGPVGEFEYEDPTSVCPSTNTLNSL